VTTLIARPTETLSELYEKDETAWLDAMAELATHGRAESLDLLNLAEFLESMATRDRRESNSRLLLLLMHLLKWEYQPEARTGSWRRTIFEQRRQLCEICESGTLRNYLFTKFEQTYDRARYQASIETDLPLERFPIRCPFTLDELLADTELPI